MVIRDLALDKPYATKLLVTVECPICEALKGDDYAYFAWHLATEHGPEDVGLGGGPNA